MKRAIASLGCLGIGLLGVRCLGQVDQTAAAFDVASVRRVEPDTKNATGQPAFRMAGGPGTSTPERLTYRGVTIKQVLVVAYGLKDFLIIGPGSIDQDRFDIMGNLPAATSPEVFRAMLQNLVRERLGVRSHLEMRELPVYELVVAKSGAKLVPSGSKSAPESAGSLFPPTGGFGFHLSSIYDAHVIAKVRPISKLVDFLEDHMTRPVIDRTGLSGTYDFTLDYSQEGLPRTDGIVVHVPDAAVPNPDVPASRTSELPSLSSALEGQLGLHLENKKALVNVLVVDHAERFPTEN